VNSVAELIAYAKAWPGALNHGSTGTGPIFVQHLFKLRTNTQFENVAYNGTGPALNDLLRGDIQMMFDLVPGVMEQIEAGAVRALAVSAPSRVSTLPDVPTLVEAGVPGIETTNWLGIIGPAGVPAPIVARMSDAIQEIVKMPAVVARLLELGVQPVGSSSTDFASFVEEEAAMWTEVAQRAGIQPE
jgi:tripartite-type tricarboxylate transporter receptor subunit TctC